MAAMSKTVVYADPRNDVPNDVIYNLNLGYKKAGGPTAKAIRYALNHRQGLERFLEDGRMETDSNVVERAIRPLVLSRKNALFAGPGLGPSSRR